MTNEHWIHDVGHIAAVPTRWRSGHHRRVCGCLRTQLAATAATHSPRRPKPPPTSSGAGGWANDCSAVRRTVTTVKACVTPALTRRRSRYPSASGQVLHKPRGRKPRRTPRWPLSAAAMAIEWRWCCDPAARGASSRPYQRTRIASDAPLHRGRERQRIVQVPSSRNARSDPPDAMVGVELVDRDCASS